MFGQVLAATATLRATREALFELYEAICLFRDPTKTLDDVPPRTCVRLRIHPRTVFERLIAYLGETFPAAVDDGMRDKLRNLVRDASRGAMWPQRARDSLRSTYVLVPTAASG